MTIFTLSHIALCAFTLFVSLFNSAFASSDKRLNDGKHIIGNAVEDLLAGGSIPESTAVARIMAASRQFVAQAQLIASQIPSAQGTFDAIFYVCLILTCLSFAPDSAPSSIAPIAISAVREPAALPPSAIPWVSGDTYCIVLTDTSLGIDLVESFNKVI